MSVLFKTTGIILGWKPYREHDRFYSVFTKEHGKIEFVARGGQKTLAKLTPHLETPAEVRLLLVDGRFYYTVAGTDRIQAFSSIYTDLTKIVLVQNALALFEMGTRAHEVDLELYSFLISWVQFISELPEVSAERAGFLLTSFAIKFLARIGYCPELNQCLVCRTSIREGLYRWHALKGGVVCEGCYNKDQEQWFSARSMQDETLKLLRFSLKQNFSDQLRPYLSGNILVAFHEIIESLLVNHFPVIPAVTMREACKYL